MHAVTQSPQIPFECSISHAATVTPKTSTHTDTHWGCYLHHEWRMQRHQTPTVVWTVLHVITAKVCTDKYYIMLNFPFWLKEKQPKQKRERDKGTTVKLQIKKFTFAQLCLLCWWAENKEKVINKKNLLKMF